MTNRHMLWAGVAGSVVFVATVVMGGLARPGYSHLENAVSELTERGAPDTAAISIGFGLSALLMGVFGLAVMRHGSAEPRHRQAGLFLLGYTISGFLCGTIFPMDPFGAPMTFSGMMHIVLVAVSALFIMAAIVVGGLALRDERPWFFAYSWASLALMLTGGALSAIGPAMELPILGAAERLTQGAYLAWIAVFAVVLVGRAEAGRPRLASAP